jgi:2-polyprenyl-6-hydroxyphenyl methylase/3-demethylubiquinone-9 3-methyltransferase
VVETTRELAKFDAIASEWWNAQGPMEPLHRMQPVRLNYIRRQLMAAGIGDASRPRSCLKGRRVVDFGCGAGLASEPLARLGADVTAIDLAEKALEAAKTHADFSGLTIDYQLSSAEMLAEKARRGDIQQFDAAISLELVEHLAEPDAFLAAAATLLKPGAPIILTTLNRTAQSFLGGIVVAEYLMRWLPPGTHEWSSFVKPDELAQGCQRAGLTVIDQIGFVYNPFSQQWRESEGDLSVNYALTAIKPRNSAADGQQCV